jgi:hypothetical protein
MHSGKIRDRKCLGPDMSQVWTCLRCLKLLLHKKAEKERLRRSKNISRPDLSKHFWARLVSGLDGARLVLRPDLSRGRNCLGAGLVSGPDLSQGRTCPKTSGPEVSKSFRASSVSRPEVSKSLGLEVSRGRTWFTAGLVLELQNVQTWTFKNISKLKVFLTIVIVEVEF